MRIKGGVIIGVLGVLIIAVLACIFMPLLAIWGLNTLFPILAIPYTLKTWFAIIVVCAVFVGTNNVHVNRS